MSDLKIKKIIENLIETFLEAGKVSLVLREKGLSKKIKSDNLISQSVMLEENGRKETGVYGVGGRQSYDTYLKDNNWKSVCDEALRIATVNLESKPAPAGEMKVVLGPGWPAILIHEAVGHGLE